MNASGSEISKINKKLTRIGGMLPSSLSYQRNCGKPEERVEHMAKFDAL